MVVEIEILFIQPFIKPEIRSAFFKLMYSYFSKIAFFDTYLAFQQLAAVTPRRHSIKIFDERFENINFNERCDIVGITFPTGFAPRAYEIADEFRRRGKTVVLGGPHVSILPEEAKQHADSVVIGEAELIWPQLLKDYENEGLKPFYKQETPIDPRLIPAAKRNIGNSLFPIAQIQATRGCPIGCEFCRVPVFEGTTLRKRPIENVIEEIKSIPQKFLFFLDASLTLDPEYSKNLFNEMKGLGKKFCCCGNTDVLGRDDEFLKLAKEAGCMMWYVGFETISQEIIDRLGKKTNKVEEYPVVVQKIHEYKMAVSGSFIFGFDEDPKDLSDRTVKVMNEINLDLAEINVLTPFPGTPLFERLEREGRITIKDWFHYREGQHGTEVVFEPKNMSREELYDHYDTAFRKWFYGLSSIKRISKSIKIGFYPSLYVALANTFHI